jgi:AcrR family transcriptional regulator
MDEIASEIGISKKTLYRHFRSRSALLAELVEQHMRVSEAEMKAICAGAKTDPRQCLRELLDYIASVYREVSATAFRDLEKYAPELWDVVQSYRQKHFETDFANLIREGRRQGVFRKDVDVKVFLFLYSQAAQHVLNPEAFRMLGVSAHKVFESVCKVLFEGLLTERAR